MQNMRTALGQVSHAAALRATARVMLVLSTFYAMKRAFPLRHLKYLRRDDADVQFLSELLASNLWMFKVSMCEMVLLSVVLVIVQIIVYSRLGTQRMNLGIPRFGLLLQTFRWMWCGVALVIFPELLSPIWEWAEMPPGYMEVEVFRSVLVGVSLGLLITCSRFKITAESSTRVAASH